MFLGPGRYGPYCEEVYRPLIEQGIWTKQKIGTIERFATKVEPGHVVLLRNRHRVVSIGVVAEEGYEYKETFDDVLGWDLQHVQRVIWQDHLTGELEQIQKKSLLYGSIIGPMPMFTAVNNRQIRDRVENLFGQCRTRPLKPMPEKIPPPLELDELGAELFSKGLSNEAVDKVILAIQRQRRLAKWYEEHGEKSKRPKEHEVVAHMILPLLLALGWSEQLLAVEWHKIDLAVFSRTPTTAENCCLVCEAKGLERALEEKVFDQAVKYADGLKPNNCKKILLTDGIRLYLYQRKENGKWKQSPDGYLNIRLIRTNHIAPAETNAVDTIMALTPAGINRELVSIQRYDKE
jgi:hypothetical protein